MLGVRHVPLLILAFTGTAIAGPALVPRSIHADAAPPRLVLQTEARATAVPTPAVTVRPTPVAVRSLGGSERPKLNKPDRRPAPPPMAAVPITGKYAGPNIEEYARYEGQSTCDPTDKPGTVALRNTLLAHYPVTVSFGISRACNIGGKSEHHEGRAFDWGANVNNPVQRAAVENFFKVIFATDSYGHTDAIARRMGLMYVIWNKQIRMLRPGSSWEPYSGDSPHTDHVHISMSWAGARAQTSFWSGHVPSELLDVPETPPPHHTHEPWPTWSPDPTHEPLPSWTPHPTHEPEPSWTPDPTDDHPHWPPDATPSPTPTAGGPTA